MSPTLIDWRAAAALLVVFLALAALMAGPFVTIPTGGRSDENAARTAARRVAAFLAAFSLLSWLYIWWALPAADHLYGRLVAGLSGPLVRDQRGLGSMLLHPQVGTRFLFCALFLCLAVSIRGSPVRRALVAAHALLFLGAVTAVDGALVATSAVMGWKVTPFGLAGDVIANLLGVVVLARMARATFPSPRVCPRGRGRSAIGAAALALFLPAAVALTMAAVAALRLQSLARGLAPLILSAALPIAALGLARLLPALVRLVRQSPPPMTGERPPIDVVVRVRDLGGRLPGPLTAIDRAAARYRGPVRLTVCAEGSDARTAELAGTALASFRSARGQVLRPAAGGAALELGRLLDESGAPIVVRVDAGAVVDERAFVFTQRWFRDPSVGMVRGLNRPLGGNVWLRKMRWFECLGDLMGGGDAVDGYVAVRRHLAKGGAGLGRPGPGDEVDPALRTRRAGRRVVLDPAIRVWERAPASVAELRSRRIEGARRDLRLMAAGSVRPSLRWATGVAAPLLAIHVVQLALLIPADRPRLTPEALPPALGALAAISLVGALSVIFRRASDLRWLATWWLYALACQVFALEAMFTLTARPVGVDRASRAAGAAASTQAAGEEEPDLAGSEPASVTLTASVDGKAIVIGEGASRPPAGSQRTFVAAAAGAGRLRNPAVLAAVDLLRTLSGRSSSS
jgi:hypothetical protein